jgi:hypothetical protein
VNKSQVTIVYAKLSKCISKSSNFWIIARAIRDFVQNEGSGLLPLPGKLPDMKADTKGYVRLQQMYVQIDVNRERGLGTHV